MGPRRFRTRAGTATVSGCASTTDPTPTPPGWWPPTARTASSARRWAIGFPGVPVVERFLLADVHADIDLQRGGATSWLRGDMMLAVFPLPGIDLWRVMAPAPTGFGDEPARSGDRGLSRCAAGRRGGRNDSLRGVDIVVPDPSQAGGLLPSRPRPAGRRRRAHPQPIRRAGHEHRYRRRREPGVEARTGRVRPRRRTPTRLPTRPNDARSPKVCSDSTSGATEVAVGQGRASRLLRDRIAVPLMNQGWLQNLITERTSQLRVSYRHGPLGAGRRGSCPECASGDRVADRTLHSL